MGFALALNVTLPVPLPDAPAVTVNQLVLLLAAVHAQPACAVTVLEPVPPPAATDWLVGEIEYEQETPACVTVNVWVPIVRVPVRWLVPALAEALKLTLPLPLPDAPAVTVSHPVLLLTPVHAHPVGAVTDVEPVPPAATID